MSQGVFLALCVEPSSKKDVNLPPGLSLVWFTSEKVTVFKEMNKLSGHSNVVSRKWGHSFTPVHSVFHVLSFPVEAWIALNLGAGGKEKF